MCAVALVDCRNFYVSCERVFNPKLMNRPAVVLSNNDGCIIARSEEAKTAGVRMGAPYHEEKEHLARMSGAVLSSNYALYGDMSARVMSLLGEFSPKVEIYSIDEAFLDFGNFVDVDLMDHARRMRERALRWTGIPVGVGIGPTKVIAKTANKLAKRNGGVFALLEESAIRSALAGMAVEDTWGIGGRWGKRLRRMGIETALALREADPTRIRQSFGVVVQRILYELRGVSCLLIENAPPAKKEICVSRSFRKRVGAMEELSQATASYATRAAEKLRRNGSRAYGLSVFIHTNHFREGEPQYSGSGSVRFAHPTSDTGLLIRAALAALRRIHRPGYLYHKAGVLLFDIAPARRVQDEMFDRPDFSRSDAVMSTLDALNTRMGRATVRYGAEGFEAAWRMKGEMRSPRYTTSWEELAQVRAV
ncbi:MAG: Y-family DNA polymerase [Nitrospinota bacterium]|nr:Y-family DNA polymerase [Nitrospinota bacterium]